MADITGVHPSDPSGAPLLRVVLLALAVLVVAGATLVGAMVVGMRRRSPRARRMVRGFARTVVNPRVLRTAGTPGATASVVHHTGRRTGPPYRTPVDAQPTEDGFVIALPYGTSSNWVRNVLASGTATLVREGATHRLDAPALVPLADVAVHFPEATLRSLRRFRVDECLRLRSRETSATTSAASPAA